MPGCRRVPAALSGAAAPGMGTPLGAGLRPPPQPAAASVSVTALRGALWGGSGGGTP